MLKSEVVKTHYTLCMMLAVIVCFFNFIPLHANSPNRELKAIVTANNDFTTDEHPEGREIAVPKAVAKKIKSLVNEAYANLEPSLKREYSEEYFYGNVFRITAPGGRELYVFLQTGPLGVYFYYFILFDPKTNKVTKMPPCIYAKWMLGPAWGAELKKPLASFEDIDGDETEECVIQERVHNGTVYNAIVYHYYHISPDLSLRPVLAVETRLRDITTEDQDGIINRTLQKTGIGEVLLDVSLDCSTPNPLHRELGSVLLRSPEPGSPFKIVKKIVLDPDYGGLLITASGEDEFKFTIKGYDFYY